MEELLVLDSRIRDWVLVPVAVVMFVVPLLRMHLSRLLFSPKRPDPVELREQYVALSHPSECVRACEADEMDATQTSTRQGAGSSSQWRAAASRVVRVASSAVDRQGTRPVEQGHQVAECHGEDDGSRQRHGHDEEAGDHGAVADAAHVLGLALLLGLHTRYDRAISISNEREIERSCRSMW